MDTVQRRPPTRQRRADRAEAIRRILTELGGDATTREIARVAIERGLFADSSTSWPCVRREITRALSAENPETGVAFAIPLPANLTRRGRP